MVLKFQKDPKNHVTTHHNDVWLGHMMVKKTKEKESLETITMNCIN